MNKLIGPGMIVLRPWWEFRSNRFFEKKKKKKKKEKKKKMGSTFCDWRSPSKAGHPESTPAQPLSVLSVQAHRSEPLLTSE